MNRQTANRAMGRLLGTIALVLMLAPMGIGADEGKPPAFSGYTKCEKYHVTYDVNADGTYAATRDALFLVLSEEGVKSANHAGFSYSESLEEAVILWAYTLKKDGRRIDVPPHNIQEREGVAHGGPMFSDIKAKVIIFPDVAAGDRVGYCYKVVRKTALFPGQFSLTEVFTRFMVYDDVRVSVSAPVKSIDLKIFAAGVRGGRMEDRDGRMQWVWTHENREIALPEAGSVDPVDYGPRIFISSFKDYGAMAQAYEERARAKAAVTDKIRTLAAELTAGTADPREKARILYEWVVQNIHFAGNYLGIGSVVPHDAEVVLANRLGDCKDHTALFQALLAAVGIESTPVLINSGFSYTLPEVPSMRVLNHVITYIPSLDLYADSSAEFTPFGQLPAKEYGKPVVHTAGFDGIRRTPLLNSEGQRSSMKMTLTIHEDGSADGEALSEETGIFAQGVRAVMAFVQPNMEDLIVRSILESSGHTGTGTLIKADPRQMSDLYTHGAKFHLANAVNLPGPGAVLIAPVFPSGHPISSVVTGLNLPERTLEAACLGDLSTEEYTYHFPKNVEILSVPKDAHFANATVRYDSTYRREGNTVTVHRSFRDQTPGPVCTPADDKEFRIITRDILRDLKAQILYQ